MRIELVKKGIQNGNPVSNYALIIIDYNMPGMLGTEVATRICKLYKDAQITQPKLFCCTSEQGDHFTAAVFAAGMLGILNKPLRMDQLKIILDREIPDDIVVWL